MIALKLEDSKEKARPQWLFSRNCPAYRPGAWSPSSGSEIVDTSGKHMEEEEEFESYNRILDIEAEHLDTAEDLEANKLELCLLAEQLGPLMGHAEEISRFWN
jgi:hypothetical protein